MVPPKSFVLTFDEINVIRHAVEILQRDVCFDMRTYVERNNLDALQSSINTLFSIDSILSKVNF